MIEQAPSAEVGRVVAHNATQPYLFAVGLPTHGGSVAGQTRDALRAARIALDRQEPDATIVRQTVFLSRAEDRPACRRALKAFYGAQGPATSYVVQPPCGGQKIAVEAWGCREDGAEVRVQRCSEQMAVVRYQGLAWAHCCQVTPGSDRPGVYDRAASAFRQMEDLLAEQGVPYAQVLRTWLYLGDIVGPEGPTQRYKELNRARADYYGPISFLQDHLPSDFSAKAYPASTGIGTGGTDVVMECLALATDRSDVVVRPLENPRQVSAFDYGTRFGPRSPQFSRAMAVVVGDQAILLVSGTASIVDAETVCLGDVAGQTRQTLDNIETLIGETNLARNRLPGLGATLDDLALTRVYVKSPTDFPVVQSICRRRLPDCPTLYVVADVCRPDLLVEIEAVAVPRSASAALHPAR